jgi:hypothetical protein
VHRSQGGWGLTNGIAMALLAHCPERFRSVSVGGVGVPIVMSATERDSLDCLTAAQVSACLVKPFDLVDLATAIERRANTREVADGRACLWFHRDLPRWLFVGEARSLSA